MEMRVGFARLLLGTALVVPTAFATGAAAQQAPAAGGEACQQLIVLTEEGLPEPLQSATPDILVVAEAGEAERCERVLVELQAAMQAGGGAEQVQSLQMTDSERAVIRLQDEAVIEGQVYVETQPPQVEVQQGQTEVMVTGGQPQVSVTEQPAEILVRQAPAMIRMEMPQPTITIEQPAPEIIITMPPPGVEVTNAEPQVEVRQAEPQVTVTQVAPNVEIELQQAEDPNASQGIQVTDRATGEPLQAGQAMEVEAEVAMAQSEPTVTYQEAEAQENSVQLQRAEPQIRFEQAEPQVEFVGGGEPQVQFVQSGEPTVTFQEAAAQEQPAVGAEAPAAIAPAAGTELEAGQIETDPSAGEPAEGEAVVAEEPVAEPVVAEEPVAEPVVARPQVEREGYQMVEVNELEASELEGANVYGLEDEEIGEIGELLLNEQGQIEQAVIDVGGFLGIGERNVAIPFDQLTILRGEGDDIRVYVDSTEDRLEEMPEYEG